jgi:AcrR family transcriptional regulator
MTEIDIRQSILLAAEKRFQVYGFNKTTMAEIASDIDMSAANLYRYFKNKLDIGAALAEKCLDEKEAFLADVINDQQLSSPDKLTRFVHAILSHTYTHCEEDPKMNELVQAMTTQRPDVIDKHHASTLAMISRLLEEGRMRGEFEFKDLDATAEATNTAIILFFHPLILMAYPLDTLQTKATNLCGLLLNGLKK